MSALQEIAMESSGNGMLAPASLEACFNVTIFGDDVVEDSPETVSLRVTSGATLLVDIVVYIQDDDASKLKYSGRVVAITDETLLITLTICNSQLQLQL